jgi:hypothetical protein
MKTTGLPPLLARVPFGVLRPRDAELVYPHPRAQLARLVARGRLHRLATGYYATVPPSVAGDVGAAHAWLPSLEAAGYGIGAADYGPQATVLMGLSAARLLGALPRALAVCVVAVPRQRPPISLGDRDAQVVFVRRATDRLDAQRAQTDLGSALITGPEQTVLDLAHRPELGGVPAEAREAVRALLPRCDVRVLQDLAVRTRRGATLRRAVEWGSCSAEPHWLAASCRGGGSPRTSTCWP